MSYERGEKANKNLCVFFSCENVNEELGPDDDKRYQWLQAAQAQPAPRSFAPASYGVCQSSSSSPELRRRPTGCGLCRLRCDWPAARGLCYLLWNMFSSHPEIVPGTRAWPCPVHNYITASRKVPCLFALCAHGEQTGKKSCGVRSSSLALVTPVNSLSSAGRSREST